MLPVVNAEKFEKEKAELLTLPKVYGFEDRMPVGIYGGDCQVDFGEIVRRAWGCKRPGKTVQYREKMAEFAGNNCNKVVIKIKKTVDMWRVSRYYEGHRLRVAL